MEPQKETLRQRILAAAMEGVRRYGIEGLRIQHIGALAGGAPSNIYAYYRGKEDLLQACFDQVDRQLARLFERPATDPAADPETALRRLWTPYWRWLTAHPSETVFYHKFRDSAQFSAWGAGQDTVCAAAFLAGVERLRSRYCPDCPARPDLLWLHLLTATVTYAKYVAEGVLPNDSETENWVFCLTARGFQGLLGQPEPAPRLAAN